MKQQSSNVIAGPHGDRNDALTGTRKCSYFVPSSMKVTGTMSVVIFGRSKTAQIHGREQPLDCAAQIGLGERMHAWRGASGQRYIVSVYAPEAAPDYDDAVVLHIARKADHRRILRIVDDHESIFVEPGDVNEVHVHLMARGAAARAALIADLLA